MIVFSRASDRDDVASGMFVMNADDGSGMNKLAEGGFSADWGSNTSPAGGGDGGNGDTTPPVLTVPEDMVVETNSSEGAAEEVTYTVTAKDDVDGTATLEEDGTTITQDDVGGDIDISCEPASGSAFPIGDDGTEVECSATDEAGNTGTESFTVTVNSPQPPSHLKQIIDELISTIQNLDQVPQSVKASLIATLKQLSDNLSDGNPNNDDSTCGRLDVFINHLNAAERRGALTEEQADELRTQAEDIMDRLDC